MGPADILFSQSSRKGLERILQQEQYPHDLHQGVGKTAGQSSLIRGGGGGLTEVKKSGVAIFSSLESGGNR